MEARFYSAATGPEIPGSPIVAQLHLRCIQALKAHYQSIDDERSLASLEKWLQWDSGRREHRALVRILAEMKWHSWDHERKLAVARELIVPFNASEDYITSLVDEASQL